MKQNLDLQTYRDKGPRKNNFGFCAPGCAADLAWAIEESRRRSLAYVENFLIEPEAKIGTRSGAGRSGQVQIRCEKRKLFLREPQPGGAGTKGRSPGPPASN